MRHFLSYQTYSRSLLPALTMVAAVLFIAAVGGCGDSNDQTTQTDAQNTSSSASTKKERVATNEYVMELASKRLGDPGLVRTAQVTETGGKKYVTVEIGRPPTCHDGAVVGEVALFTQQVMGLLFQDPAVEKIDITMYGATEEEGTKDVAAMTVTVDRATANRIDWFQFNYQNMLQLVTSYSMHPNIEQSFKNEGGSIEGTNSQLQQAGSAPAT